MEEQRQQPDQQLVVPPQAIDEEIDAIIGMRQHRGKLQYQIQRSGVARGIWKDADKINAPAAIDDFHSKRLLRGEYHGIPTEAIELEDSDDSDSTKDSTMVIDAPQSQPTSTMDTTQVDVEPTMTTTEVSHETRQPPATSTSTSRSRRQINRPTRFQD